MTGYSTTQPEFDLEEMMAVTRRLSELVHDDMAQLKQLRIGKLKDTHQEKLQLASILEGYQIALKANPELLKTISKETLEKARNDARTFDATVKTGHQELKKAHTAHGAVLDLIRDVVSERTTPVRCYGKNGTYGNASRDHMHTKPLNLDERI